MRFTTFPAAVGRVGAALVAAIATMALVVTPAWALNAPIVGGAQDPAVPAG